MKIAILTIATNKYKDFLYPLISSIEKYFVVDSKKDYYIFSDEHLHWFNDYNVHYTHIEHESWPYITLKRFEYISKISDKLKEYDYVIYFDSDMEFVHTIPDFNIGDKKYIAVCHPSSFRESGFWPVETNSKSTAYVSSVQNCLYVQGCLWGAVGSHIVDMINTLKNNINIDLSNDVVAIWHDESHLNKFFIENAKDVAVLHAGFAYPENWRMNLTKYIVHKDKNMVEYPRFPGAQKSEVKDDVV